MDTTSGIFMSENIMLGETIFVLDPFGDFWEFRSTVYVTQWLEPVRAGVVPDYSEYMYRSFDADVMSYHKVWFNLGF